MKWVMKCQCENEKHTETFVGHDYQQEFPFSQITVIETPYGAYRVCALCSETCLKKYSKANQNMEIKK